MAHSIITLFPWVPPFVPHIIPPRYIIASTSMMSGSTSFQGFPFGSGHIPHSNPTIGSMPFSFTCQVNNPFQSWTNPTVSGIGVGNQFFGQKGNVSYYLVNSF